MVAPDGFILFYVLDYKWLFLTQQQNILTINGNTDLQHFSIPFNKLKRNRQNNESDDTILGLYANPLEAPHGNLSHLMYTHTHTHT